MGNSMTESIELISKKAAIKGLESSIEIYLKRIESLSVQYSELSQEILEMENAPQMIVA
jgi:archaellum component FlaC